MFKNRAKRMNPRNWYQDCLGRRRHQADKPRAMTSGCLLRAAP